jgi:tetratricopeptide (TPR) repeat protein
VETLFPKHLPPPELGADVLLAKALIQAAIHRSPDDPEQYRFAKVLARYSDKLRDPELALKLARRALKLKPGDPECLESQGWALFRAGDWKGCIETLEKQKSDFESVDLMRRNLLSRLIGERQFILAMAYWRQGNKPEARAHFDRGNEWLAQYEKQCNQMGRHHWTERSKRVQAEAETLLGLPAVNPPINRTPIHAERPAKRRSAGVAAGG